MAFFDNNIYVADSNQRVLLIDNLGIVHTLAGTGVGGYNGDGILAASAQLYVPEGPAVDACGSIYIADNLNNRIRKVTFPHCGYLSVFQKNIVNVSIYPNPTNDAIHIDGVKNNDIYRLYTVVGTLMQRGRLQEGSNEVPLRSLPTGVYMMEVTNSTGNRTITKIIKQ